MKHLFNRNWLERASLPDETLPKQTLIELCSDSRVLIEHHQGVAAYTNETIIVRLKNGGVCVTGFDLKLCRISGPQLIIVGKIRKIEFLKECAKCRN